MNAAIGSCWAWLHATRARHWTFRAFLAFFLLAVVPAIIGAVATATATTSTLAAGGHSSGTAWMNVQDSYGVPVSNYMFATNRGSILNPGNTALALVLDLESAGYLVIVTTAVWLIGYALSFAWLNMFSKALTGVGDALTGSIATPLLTALAAAIGAFIVGYFIVRGFHAKATLQVLTMLVVAILGPLFLAHPLGEALSSDGLLAQGRDFGIAVAAGINGQSSPNPRALVTSMQRDLADNFARKPLQTWNFGHVIDTRANCRSSWSSAMLSSDADKVLDAVKNCDSTAYNSANNPNAAQIGTGLLLLFSATVLLLFAMYLAIKIIWAALNTIYHGIKVIFGFAAGGFIYGPTQTALIRDIIHGVMTAAEMAAYTIFLGIYVLFLGNLFDQARGQVMAVFIIGAIVELVAIIQLRRLSRQLRGGNDWIANRFAFALQNPGSTSAAGVAGGGGSGGRALGMGSAGAGNALGGGLGTVAAMAALNTFNANPVTGLLFGRVNPLNRFSVGRQQSELRMFELQRRNHLNRENWRRAGERRVDTAAGRPGIHTIMGVGNALDGILDAGAGMSDTGSILLDMGAHPDHINAVHRAFADQRADTNRNMYMAEPLAKTVGAMKHASHRFDLDPITRDAYLAQLSVASANWFSKSPAPRVPLTTAEQNFAHRVLNNAQTPGHLRAAVSENEWQYASPHVLKHIGNNLAREHHNLARALEQNPTLANLAAVQEVTDRAVHIEAVAGPLTRSPWLT